MVVGVTPEEREVLNKLRARISRLSDRVGEVVTQRRRLLAQTGDLRSTSSASRSRTAAGSKFIYLFILAGNCNV